MSNPKDGWSWLTEKNYEHWLEHNPDGAPEQYNAIRASQHAEIDKHVEKMKAKR